MADEIDPLAVRMGLILDYPRNTAGSEAWVEKFTGTSRIVAEELAAAGAAADDDLITIPDGRKLLAVEYLALMTFAYANQMTEWTLWRRVKRGRSGRVAAVGEFYWRRLTDITALASCTKIKALYLTGNHIADISALASCRELRSLWLGTNRITDISALAGCGKLDTLSLENNGVADISALTGCARLTTLSLQGNRLTEISGLASCRRLGWLYLGENQITDISALERCTRLRCVSLRGNPLAKGSEEVIAKLRARRVTVDFSIEKRPLQPRAPHRRRIFTAAEVTFSVRGDEETRLRRTGWCF